MAFISLVLLMEIIYILIPLSLVVLFIAVCFFFWAVNNDQYDDFDSPAYHVLLDDQKKNNNLKD